MCVDIFFIRKTNGENFREFQWHQQQPKQNLFIKRKRNKKKNGLAIFSLDRKKKFIRNRVSRLSDVVDLIKICIYIGYRRRREKRGF